MASAKIPETIRRVFTEAFTARDIAEPLASFDAGTAGADVCDFMKSMDFDVVGVRAKGRVEGYVDKRSLKHGACGNYQLSLDQVRVLDDTAPLLTVLMELNHAPFLFISMLDTVCGIITPTDVQKPPARMWLFGIVTMIEMRFSELIETHCSADTWKPYVSEARLQKAQALLEERIRRNQALGLLDCLQFADKGQIIARHEEIRNHTIFRSRRQAELAVKQLEQLRNNVAHAQDILTTDWDMITQLCEFVKQ